MMALGTWSGVRSAGRDALRLLHHRRRPADRARPVGVAIAVAGAPVCRRALPPAPEVEHDPAWAEAREAAVRRQRSTEAVGPRGPGKQDTKAHGAGADATEGRGSRRAPAARVGEDSLDDRGQAGRRDGEAALDLDGEAVDRAHPENPTRSAHSDEAVGDGVAGRGGGHYGKGRSRTEDAPYKPSARPAACLLAAAGALCLGFAAADAARPPERAVLPLPGQVARAHAFAAGRAGVVSFAVVDTAGRLRCHGCHRRYVSASVVKAMVLVAYLRRLAVEERALAASDRALLGPMIRISDNQAATVAYRHAGGSAALYRLARAAGMRRFDVDGSWGSARITAADQARFLSRIDHLTPRRFRTYARSLLSSIVSWQSWGIPTVARARWSVFFKGGWRETGLGQLVHQVALLEQERWRIAIAVLTDGNPGHGYGRATVAGVASALLRGTASPARPWPVPVPRWFWVWARWYLHHGEFKGQPFRSRAGRPERAPYPIRDWAWRRLAALL
jgi:hypothetical protein